MKFAVHGEWEQEPDEEEFTHAGLPCQIKRSPGLGHLCGYVGVPPNHPYAGLDYDDVDVEVHGGLTFSAKDTLELGFQAGYYWFGFDCAHSRDYTPPIDEQVQAIHFEVTGRVGPGEHETYRNWEYVIAETKYLAEQLAKVERPRWWRRLLRRWRLEEA